MPFIKKIENEIGLLGVWKLSESVHELSSAFQFSDSEKVEFRNKKSERKKIEYLATRLLLLNLLNEKQEIKYLKSGKPVLANNQLNISISHSAEFATILLSKHKIGIDIENTTRNIERVAKRFLHKTESNYIHTLEDKQTASILFWGAKEAIFKCTDKSGIEFNQQIIIPSFEIQNVGEFSGSLLYEEEITNYKLWYHFFENNVIVYCVEV